MESVQFSAQLAQLCVGSVSRRRAAREARSGETSPQRPHVYALPPHRAPPLSHIHPAQQRLAPAAAAAQNEEWAGTCTLFVRDVMLSEKIIPRFQKPDTDLGLKAPPLMVPEFEEKLKYDREVKRTFFK